VGLVSERLVETGDVVPRHTHVLTLVDPASLVAELSVSELIIPHLRIGDPVSVRIDALGDELFRGRVARLHPELDPRTRQGVVEIALDPIPDGARAGLFARVTFTIEALERRVVPFASVRRDREGEFVFRVDEAGKARRTAILAGRRLADRIEILEGVEPGDRIVVKGFLGLQEGKKVTPVGAPEEERLARRETSG
jgi:membrane fusion protein (multidrug efflux system)